MCTGILFLATCFDCLEDFYWRALSFTGRHNCPVVDTTWAPSALFLFDLAISVFKLRRLWPGRQNLWGSGLDEEQIHPGRGVCAQCCHWCRFAELWVGLRVCWQCSCLGELLPVTSSCFSVCLSGFSGAVCQIDIDDCSSTPCLNGAKCIDHPNGYECQCATGQSCVQNEENM